MKHTGKTIVIAILAFLLLFSNDQFAQNRPRFVQNAGQLPENVHYKLRAANADIYFETDQLTFNFYNPELLEGHTHTERHGSEYVGHAYNMRFEGAFVNAMVEASGEQYSDRINFINENGTFSDVRSFDAIRYEGVYDGIDLHYFGANGDLKYDVIVAPYADPSVIRMTYEGADEVQLSNGILHVKNTFNEVHESIPLAYQVVNGLKNKVECEYVLEGNTVGFSFPNGYDTQRELIIDPTLIFSSYTGSTADNFGFTATYDDDGALYGGGIVFDDGYPYVIGSYSSDYEGLVDIAISKFVADGSSLEYSTYIGGSSSEAPHSMIVNSQGQLVILGSTSSSNFPTTTDAFDSSFNGGTPAYYQSNGMNFTAGSDIVVVVLSADGSALDGSTFFGGTANDGLNGQPTNGPLNYNYGDPFRGEVIVDENDNVYITSSTFSSDFPVSGGALDQTLGGTQDAIVAKFNSNVSTLSWCTYVGGSGLDAGYSLKLNSSGEIYMTGGTTSQNLAMVGSTLNTTYQGGTADGFIFRFANDGSAVINSSYIGTSSYDQSYFVEVDDDNDVYLYGQSVGSYPVTAGVYSNANGRQFIQKLSPDLSTSIYSTVFGSGGISVNISPTAFLVDICERVFISGWGGGTNNSWNSATGNTNGLAITGDAFQSTTDGSDFYFMVLEADATALLYGSYFGGSPLQEHVDGGTSRFNKDGVIHQAVCAGCGGSNAFPTTPGVVSQINGNSCNLGVIKLDLEITAVQVDITGGSDQSGCIPFEVQFESDLVNATSFVWHFGDGNTSTLADPTHIYTDPGTYEVMLIGTDTSFCTGETFTDTSFTTIVVTVLTDAAEAGNDAYLCPGESVMIGTDTVSGFTYSWSPNTGLDDPTSAHPLASPEDNTTYYLTIENEVGCEDVDSVNVQVFGIRAFPDTTICANDSVQVAVIGGSDYLWSPTEGVSDPTSQTPYITAGFASVYTVTATDGAGCVDTAQVTIGSVAAPTAMFDIAISQSCLGDSVRFINLTEGAESIEWNIGGMATSEDSPIIMFEVGQGPIVTLTAYNTNGSCIDSLTVDYGDGWFTDDSLAVKYPNVFTPNGDTYNDCFRPDIPNTLDECFTLKVFSRWGRLLYDSEKQGGNCWNGEQRTGGMVSEGTYYYIAKVRGMDHAGYVTVLYK